MNIKNIIGKGASGPCRHHGRPIPVGLESRWTGVFGSWVLSISLIGCGQMLYQASAGKDVDHTHRDALGRLNKEKPDLRLRAETFSDCGELQDYVRGRLVRQVEGQLTNIRAQKEAAQAATGPVGRKTSQASAPAAEMDSASESAESGKVSPDPLTNVQEKGVDEGDSVKIGAHHLLALNGGKLHVSDRQRLKYLGFVDFKDL